MKYQDFTDAQRAFLAKFLKITESSVVDFAAIRLPILPEDDPLGAMAAEDRDKRDGDPGVAVRETARNGRLTLSAFAADTGKIVQVKGRLILMAGEKFRQDLEQRSDLISTAVAGADAKLSAVFDRGHEISLAFKAAEAPAGLEAEARDEIAKAGAAIAEARAEVARLMAELETLRESAEAESNALRDAFLEVYQPLEEKVGELLRWDIAAAVDLDAAMKTISLRAPRNYPQATEDALALAPRIAMARTDASQAYAPLLTPVLEKIADGHKKAKALESVLKEGRWSLSDAERALTVDKLDAAKALAEGGRSVGGLAAAEKLADEAIQAINEMKGANRAQKGPDGKEVPAVTDQISDLRKAIEKCLSNSAYATRRPLDKVAMQKKYDDAAKQLDTLTPPKALALITGVSRDIVGPTGSVWGSYKERAEAQLDWDNKFANYFSVIPERIKKLDAVLGKGETYMGSLTADLQRARDMLKLEEPKSIVLDVQKLVQGIVERIKRYEAMGSLDAPTDDPAKLAARQEFLTDQSDGLSAQKKLDEDKAAFDVMFKDAQAKVAAFAKDPSLGTKRKKDEYADIRAQVDSARKMADDAKDFSTAKAVVTRALMRLDRLRTEDAGVTRENLGKIGVLWETALSNFTQGMDRLANAIATAAADDPGRADQVAKVQGALSELKRFFNPTVFKAPAAVLGSSTVAADRKRAREEILRTVGLYLDFIRSSTTMKAVVTNEFGVPGIHSLMYARLREIELEVLRNT